MTNRYEELISKFEIKLRKLIAEYQSLQIHSSSLQAELAHKNKSLIEAHGTILELRKQNDHLLMANQISGNKEERAEAKKQIDRMVREIDQCLALLDE